MRDSHKNVIKPKNKTEKYFYQSILEYRTCTKCVEESYQSYLDKFKKKYASDFNKLNTLEKTVKDYYKNKIHPKNMLPKEEKDHVLKIFQYNNTIQNLRQSLLMKLVDNKEYPQMLKVYLQCSKQNCNKYYKEYIKLMKYIINLVVLSKKYNPNLAKNMIQYNNNMISLAKYIGIMNHSSSTKKIRKK